MPGFPLAAIGAGLGLWAKQQQEQLAARERQQMLQLTLQKYQQEQRDRQGQEELSRVNFGGDAPITPVNPTGGVGVPMQQPMQRAIPAALGFDAASSPRPPQPAPSFGSPGEYGVGQPTMPQPPPFPINLAALDKTPNSFTPMRTPPAMAGGNPGIAGTGEPSGAMPTRGTGTTPETRVADASGAPPAATGQDDLAAQIAKIPLPSPPNLNLDAIRQRIQQQAPNAPWSKKEEALRNYIAQHGPEATRQYDQAMKLYENQRSVVIEQYKEHHADSEWARRYGIERKDKLEDRAATGGTVTTGQGGEQFNVQGPTARPITRTDTGEPLVKQGAKTASSNITVTGADGKEVFKGSAHPDPNAKEGESSWIDDRTQKRIEIPDDANLTILGKGGEGRQAAAQMIRLTSAANEARRQISNVAEMTMGTTTSWFQGLQSQTGKGLTEGLTRSLANKITPRDEQMMSALGRGIGRSLASLETAGAATGLVNLQESMGGLMPQKNDDRATILMKIAEMRQIAEQGIESAIAAPAVGDKQRQLLTAVRDDIAKAVPFTVPDVIKLVRKPGAETYQSFAEKLGLGQKGATAAPATGGAAGGEVIQNGWRYDGKTHQPIGPVQ